MMYHRRHGLLFFLLYLFISSSRMIAITHWYHWLHRKYFADWSYYLYISSFLTWPLSSRLYGVTFSSNFISAQWRRITIAMYYCCFLCFFFVYSSCMSDMTHWDHWLHWKYFSEQSHYRYISSFCTWPLSDWLCSVTFSSNFIQEEWLHTTVYRGGRFSLFPPCVWLQSLLHITDYIRSALLSNHIFAIYHYFIRDPYRLDNAVSHNSRNVLESV